VLLGPSATRAKVAATCSVSFHWVATVGAAGKYRVLDFAALDADTEPVRVQSVENDDVSMLFLPFKASDHQTPELVPDLSAGTAGSAIPVSAPTPAARYRGGRILPAEAPPTVNETPLPPPQTTTAHKQRKCGTRARAPRGRAFRRRGSRRGAAPTRAGPEAGDPEPAGFGAPVGDTSRVDALAGWSA
jgi:hypothetical protein